MRALLLALLGVALLTNVLWLFPQEREIEYTYARSELTVTNGTFDYRNARDGPGHEWNDLVPVGCDSYDPDRACAFDAYLAANGPVTLDGNTPYESQTAFVRIEDAYYHRTIEDTENSTVYDVERIAPRALLAEVSTNLSGAAPGEADDLPLQARVAVTGEPESTAAFPDRDDAGGVYRVDGTYYTVVIVEERSVDWPLFAEWMRLPLGVLGMFLLVAALVVGVGDRESTLRGGRR